MSRIMITLLFFTTLLFGYEDDFDLDERVNRHRVDHIVTSDFFIGGGEGLTAGIRFSYDHLFFDDTGFRLMFATNYQGGSVAGDGWSYDKAKDYQHRFGTAYRIHGGFIQGYFSQYLGSTFAITGGVNSFNPVTEIEGEGVYSYGQTFTLEVAGEARFFLRFSSHASLYFHVEAGYGGVIYHTKKTDIDEDYGFDKVGGRLQFGFGLALTL